MTEDIRHLNVFERYLTLWGIVCIAGNMAAAIVLYRPKSDAALATVGGVLIEVPMMLLVCRICNRTRGWFEASSNKDCPRLDPSCCANWRKLAEISS